MSDLPPNQTVAAAGAGRGSLTELALFFLRLGTTAFGGPAAHIAIMEDELVRRRKWLSREKFLDLLGASNLIPGPSSSELAIHIGYLRAGWMGLVVGGVCFILPAAILVAVYRLGLRALRTFAGGGGSAVWREACRRCGDLASAVGAGPHGGEEQPARGRGRRFALRSVFSV